MEAAEAHFDTRSYADVSLSQIAHSAGLSGPAIYNHFSSKDELFLAAVTERMKRYNAAAEKAIAHNGTWKERYNRLLDAIAPLQGSGGGFQSIASAVVGRLKENPKQFAEIRALREIAANHFRELIKQGIEEGDFPQDADVRILGDLLMAATTGAINTVTFYNPGSDALSTEMLKVLLRTQ